MTEIARAVIDTGIWIDIYLQNYITPPPKQPYCDILDAFFDAEFVPVYSQASFDELLRMLTTSRRVARAHNLNPASAGAFVGLIFAKAGEEVVIPGTLAVSTDRDDNPIIETAYVGRVDYLVADDAHFHEPAVLALMKSLGTEVLYSKQFRRELRRRREASERADARDVANASSDTGE
ncbi:MAG TPA: PIN domain-containing protein [Candidatus Sulfotelmatobacter sp.]|nr:PIN domain-containing protein [Candidatus Sulfotelmatobacter sp.]